MTTTLTQHEENCSIFSDLYKDAHGFRPRFDVSDWTDEDFRTEFVRLGAIIHENVELEKLAEQAAIVEFEATIVRLIEKGAKDRATAIRWMMDAEGPCSTDYFCWSLGLPYDYLR